MSDNALQVWEKIQEGQSCIAIGMTPDAAVPDGLIAIRLNCAVPWSAGTALQQAYMQVLHWLGEDAVAPSGEDSGLRVQLLGEMPVKLQEKGFVAACNRLYEASAGNAILVFDAAEHADASVRQSVDDLCDEATGLKLPWLLVAHEQPEGDIAAWIDALRAKHQDVFFWGEERGDDQALFPPFDWSVLPDGALRVIRAGAVVGSVFEAPLVARLLSLPVAAVIEALQACVDRGAPLGDYGDGRFFLPLHSVEALRGGMLPSLLAMWNGRLASLFASQPMHDEPAPLAATEQVAFAAPSSEPVVNGATDAGPTPAVVYDAEKAEDIALLPPLSLFYEYEDEDIDVDIDDDEDEASADASVASEPEEAPDASEAEPPKVGGAAPEADAPKAPEVAEEATSATSAGGFDPAAAFGGWRASRDKAEASRSQQREAPLMAQDFARAARHLLASGRIQEAFESFLLGVRHALSLGELRRGLSMVQEAMMLLEAVPPSPQRDLMRSRVLLALARLQWHGVAVDEQPPLQSALRSIQAARQALPSNAPLELLGNIATVYAGICNDLGDVPMLDEALSELTLLSRRLLASREPLMAAQLLNDQAALYIRLGDPLQASHLLYKARELFVSVLRQNPSNPVAQEELAETEHFLARLPLHAPARPGKELDAFAVAIRHTYEAEERYAGLKQPKEQARVWETRGRLKMEMGHFDEALELFEQAMWVQRRIGDRTGLARASAATAEAYVNLERYNDALQSLWESVSSNLEQGAPLGLAFNRKTFEVILQATKNKVIDISAELLDDTHQLLTSGEAYLGRMPLPSDPKEGLLHSRR